MKLGGRYHKWIECEVSLTQPRQGMNPLAT